MKKRTRKPGGGRKSNASKGKSKVVTRSFSIQPEADEALREMHKGAPLGKWLVERLGLGRTKESVN